MHRDIIIRTNKLAGVSAEELYELEKSAFQQWTDAKLYTPIAYTPLQQFQRYLADKTIFVAQDAATGELLAMRTLTLNKKSGHAAESNLSVAPKAKRQGIATRLIDAEVKWLRKRGYRFTTCTTAIPASWSVRWHLKTGYHIVGYSRSEHNNYASYVFRKQIATDVRHHPFDLLWMAPIAPLTAKLQYCFSWLATNICKSKNGKLNAIGRMAMKVRR